MRKKHSNAVGSQEIVGEHKSIETEYAPVANVKNLFKTKVENTSANICGMGYNV